MFKKSLKINKCTGILFAFIVMFSYKTQAENTNFINNELEYNLSFNTVHNNLIESCNSLKTQNLIEINCKDFKLSELVNIITDNMEMIGSIDYKNKETEFKTQFSNIIKNLNIAKTYIDYAKICETVKQSTVSYNINENCDIPKNCYLSSPFEIATRTRKCLNIKNKANFPVIVKENKFGIFESLTEKLNLNFDVLRKQIDEILPILAGNYEILYPKKNEVIKKSKKEDDVLISDKNIITDTVIKTSNDDQIEITNTQNQMSFNTNIESSNNTENSRSNLINQFENMHIFQDQLIKEETENSTENLNFLADDNLKQIKTTFSKIDEILSKINGLKYNKRLLETAIKEYANDIENADFLLQNDNFENKSLNNNKINITAKMNLWNKLYKVKKMLPFGVPVKQIYITSLYGERNNPTGKGKDRHTGIDFRGAKGTPVFSPSAGKVIFAGYSNVGYGLMVQIEHILGFSTLYAHLSKISVKKGSIIKEGDKIGEIGSTGNSSGPHLHYETRYNNRTFDPISFITVNK